jgi:hypothetical protein
MEVPERTSEQISGIQSESAGRRGQSEIVSGAENGIRAPSYLLAGREIAHLQLPSATAVRWQNLRAT